MAIGITRVLVTALQGPSYKYVVGSVFATPDLGTIEEIQALVNDLYLAWSNDPGYTLADPDDDFVDVLLANGFIKDSAVPLQIEFNMDRGDSSASEST